MVRDFNNDLHIYECLFLDPKGHVVGKTTTRTEEQLMNEVITGAFRHRAASVVLSHHHPLKIYPSPGNGRQTSRETVTLGELNLYSNMRYQLGVIGVKLIDFTIVTDRVVSISEI